MSVDDLVKRMQEEHERKMREDVHYARLHSIAQVAMPKPITKEWLAHAEAQGMVAKKDLVDGKYYAGDCRNASVARWNAAKNLFDYQRRKWGEYFVDTIEHPEDDDGYDVFVPVGEVEPKLEQVVPDDAR